MEQWSKEKNLLDNTINLREVIGVEVLSKRGISIGKVEQVRTNPDSLNAAGIIVRRGFFKKAVYFSVDYVDKFSLQGIILTIEPAFLLKGKKVVSADGKVLGKAAQVTRENNTNDLKTIIIKSLFRKPAEIPAEDIDHIGASIVLKEDYVATEKYTKK